MEKLRSIYKNLKKSPNRIYTQGYVDKTLKDIENLTLFAIKFEGYSLQDIKEIEGKILQYLKTSNMALFGICDASKIIPEFNGDIGQLNNFIGTVTFYAETLKDATEINKLIKFVLATKLSDRVRNKLVSEETPSTLESFKRIFRKVFTPRKSLSSVHNELAKQVQGSGSVVQFANKIESLVASLNELQIAELGIQNRETIVRVNEQVALSTFKDGLSEPQRTTVMAARPTSLNEAIQIAAEVKPQV